MMSRRPARIPAARRLIAPALGALVLLPCLARPAAGQAAAGDAAGVSFDEATARARRMTEPTAAEVAEARAHADAFVDVIESMLDQMIERADTELRSRGATRKAAELQNHMAILRDRFARAKIGVDRLPDAAIVSVSVVARDSRLTLLEALSTTHQGAHFDLGFVEALDEGMTESIDVPSVEHWFVDSCKNDVRLTCAAPACTIVLFVLEQLDFAMFDDIEITIFGVGVPLPNPFKFITAIAVEIAQAVCDGVECGNEAEDNFCGPSTEAMFTLTYAGDGNLPISGNDLSAIGVSSAIIKLPFVEKTITDINAHTDATVLSSRNSLWGTAMYSHDALRNRLKGANDIDHTQLDARIDTLNDLLASINEGLDIIVERVGDPEDPDPTITTVSSQLVKAAAFDEVLALESSVQTELDKVGVPADPSQTDQDTMFELLEKILAEQTESLPLELVLDRSLLDGRLIPTLFLPASAGGLIERVQALVWSEIQRAIEGGVVDVTVIEELAVQADQQLTEWRFAEAFETYARAYQRLRGRGGQGPAPTSGAPPGDLQPRRTSTDQGGRR